MFWELSFAEPASTSVLEVLGEGSGGSEVIYRSTTATNSVSLQRNRNPSYWKGVQFVIRRLEDLAGGRWQPGPP